MDLISDKLFKSQLEIHLKLLTVKHSMNHVPRVGLKICSFILLEISASEASSVEPFANQLLK